MRRSHVWKAILALIGMGVTAAFLRPRAEPPTGSSSSAAVGLRALATSEALGAAGGTAPEPGSTRGGGGAPAVVLRGVLGPPVRGLLARSPLPGSLGAPTRAAAPALSAGRAREPAGSAEGSERRLRGRVLDGSGAPLAGARIQLGSEEGAPFTITMADGRFETPPLRRPRVDVLVSHPRHVPRWEARTLDGLEPQEQWRLRAGRSLSIQVRATSGEPLADAELWLTPPPGADGKPGADGAARRIFLGRTDDLGALVTGIPREGPSALSARLPGYVDAELQLDPAGEGARELSMEPTEAARGLVIDADSGLPVTITALRLLRDGSGRSEPEGDPEGAARQALEGPTGATEEGRFLFRSLERGTFVAARPTAPGRYRVVAYATRQDEVAERKGFSEPFEGTGSLPQDLLIRVELSLEVRGRAAGPEGPAEGVELELVRAPAEPLPPHAPEEELARWRGESFDDVAGLRLPSHPPALQRTRTGPGGEFLFQDLRPGRYQLRARPPGLARYVSGVVTAPSSGDIAVVLSQGCRLQGRLHDIDGTPLSHRAVVIFQEDRDWQAAWTDAEGRFSWDDLAPGTGYRLLVGRGFASETAPVLQRPLELAPGAFLALDLRVPTPREPSSSAAPSAPSPTEPSAAPKAPPATPPSQAVPLEGARTGEEGATLATAADGDADADDLDDSAAEAPIEPASPPEEAPASAEPVLVRLRVVGPDGVPFRGEARVRLTQGGRKLREGKAIIDEVLVLEAPGPGRYELEVETEGRRASRVLTVTPRLEGEDVGPGEPGESSDRRG